MTEQDMENCRHVGPRLAGCKSVSFSSKEEAVAAAKAIGADFQVG